MIARYLRAGFLIAALGVAGCTDSALNVSGSADAPIPAKLLQEVQGKGMTKTSAIMARVFKEENVVEIWKAKPNGRFALLKTYPICKMSGKLGPKYMEGDRQAPEGFYTVRPGQMNPNSQYHLAFNIGYPNAYDKANGRTGANLMVHGACSSSGCFSMNDPQITEIYALAREAFKGGQTEFQIQSFPFRMTAANMARYRNDPNYAFWKMLKEGYDQFEITRVPVKVDVCEKRYVFNQFPEDGSTFSPTGACPMNTRPDQVSSAYQSYEAAYNTAFDKAVTGSTPAPKASINGTKEANLVADWTRRRGRGERITIDPPSMDESGNVTETSRMGRIDSAVGRRMAALDAEKAAKARADEEKRLAKERAAEEKRLAKEQAAEAKKAAALAKADPDGAKGKAEAKAGDKKPADAANDATADASVDQADQSQEQKTGFLSGFRKRLFGS